MNVLFEFLSEEPIDNVITCMNFKFDKVVFFGYQTEIDKQMKIMDSFLTGKCGVQKTVYHSLSRDDLRSVLSVMRTEIEYELDKSNFVFFDITGGESVHLVAFGMFASEYCLPVHMYDVPSGKLIELDEGSEVCMSAEVERQHVRLNLNSLIKLHGGKVNYALKKDIKEHKGADFGRDVDGIWQVAKKSGEYWNSFSNFISANLVPDENLQVNESAKVILNSLKNADGKLNTPAKLNQILDALEQKGVILDLQHSDGEYKFRYKNEDVKDCLFEGGSILELHIFQCEMKKSDECHVGVHIDWDGKIHDRSGVDVLNEIDVISLKGFVPTFISCKSGKMGSQQALHALYELDAVANRFGGKYVRKVLATTNDLGEVYMERAREMGIEVK